jgi:hypothetical protein
VAPYVPTNDATTLHVYVDTFKVRLGPVMRAHVVTPGTFVIAHSPIGDGATAPVGPLTVAVNVIVDPRVAELAFARAKIFGVAVPTIVEAPDCGEVGR